MFLYFKWLYVDQTTVLLLPYDLYVAVRSLEEQYHTVYKIWTVAKPTLLK